MKKTSKGPNKIEKYLKSIGCEVWRDLYPDKGTNLPPVDLVFHRKDFGAVGVVSRDIKTINQGERMADAVTRIQDKYKGNTYSGDKIEQWCILLPTEVLSYIDGKSTEAMASFLIPFLNEKYEISVMQFFYEDETYCMIDGVRLDG